MAEEHVIRHRREIDIRPAVSPHEPGFLGVVQYQFPDGTVSIRVRGSATDLTHAAFDRGGVPRKACAQCDYLACGRTVAEAERTLADHILAIHLRLDLESTG